MARQLDLALARHLEPLRFQLGQIQSQTIARSARSLLDAEFRVFSQWGEDGIIEHLIQRVPIEDESFVEFGVESYTEANTRFLLMHRNWRGLILDGGSDHLTQLRSPLGWRHDLTAVQAFITAENINELLENHGYSGDLGLLSIDVDGNDYWIWKALNVATPRIVVVEYNAVFGPDAAVTIPYDPSFQRSVAHHSNLYWGASLRALTGLAEEKGYRLVGTNRAGNNAFFLRSDLDTDVPSLSVQDAFRVSRFRESRNRDGGLSYLSGRERAELIADQLVVDTTSMRTTTFRALIT